jgi:hypothetical protein
MAWLIEEPIRPIPINATFSNCGLVIALGF